MQLFLILMLLMYGGKGGDTLKTLRPVLETFGGEEVKSALKSAEELEGIISAFNGGADKESNGSSDGSFGGHSDGRSDIPSDRPSGGVKDAGRGQSGSSCSVGGKESAQSSVGSEQPSYAQGGYPLDHVAGIADKEILYRLAKYFSSAGAD